MPKLSLNWKKTFVWIVRGVVVLALLVTGGFFGIPYAIEAGVKNWFEDHGVEQVLIGEVQFFPMQGQVNLRDLSIQQNGKPELEVGSVELEFGLGDGRSGWIVIKKMIVAKSQLAIRRPDTKKLSIAGIQANRLFGKDKAGTGFKLLIKDLQLQQMRIDYHHMDWSRHLELDLVQLKDIAGIRVNHQGDGQLNLECNIGGGEVAFIGRLNLARGDLQFVGDLGVKRLPLAWFSPLMQPTGLSIQGGDIEGQWRTNIGMPWSERRLKISAEGKATATSLSARWEQAQLAAAKTSWQGKFNLKTPVLGNAVNNAAFEFVSDGKTHMTGVSAKFRRLSLVNSGVSWQGNFDLSVMNAQIKVTAAGEMAADELELDLPVSQFNRLGGGAIKLSWNGTLKIDGALGKVEAASFEGGLGLDAANLLLATDARRQVGINLGKTEWTGDLHLVDSINTPAGVSIRGNGQSMGLGLAFKAAGVSLSLDDIIWSGDGHIGDAPKFRSLFRHKGFISAGEFKLSNNSQTSPFLKIDQPSVPDIFVGSAGNIRFGQLSAKGLAIPFGKSSGLEVKGKSQLEMDDFTVRGFNLIRGRYLSLRQIIAERLSLPVVVPGNDDPAKLYLSEVIARDLNADAAENIQIAKLTAAQTYISGRAQGDGKQFLASELTAAPIMLWQLRELRLGELELVDPLLHLTRKQLAKLAIDVVPKADTNAVVEQSSTGQFVWSLDLLSTRGRRTLIVEDQSGKTPVRLNLNLSRVLGRRLGSLNPWRQSQIDIRGKLGKYTRIELSSKYWRSMGALNAEVLADIRNLSLPFLTTYLERYMGYRVKRGRLSVKSTATVSRGKLKASNKLHFERAAFETVDNVGEEVQLTKLDLDTAFNLLSDSKDRVDLEVQLSGDLANPKFKMNYALNQAVAKSVGSALVLYYQPLGVLIGLGKMLGNLSNLQFKPMSFPPGSTDLSRSNLAMLGKISKALSERPKLKLNICGIANSEDRRFLNQTKKRGSDDKKQIPVQKIGKSELRALAQRRSETVKDYLVEQEGLGETRLFLCAPEIRESGVFGVEIGT